MKCPRCKRELKAITAGDITVEACEGGCGGIWFDAFELQKVDEGNESAGEQLLHLERDPAIEIDLQQRTDCPKCSVEMMRHFTSAKRGVSVDECPQCGGYWVDAGELGAIRAEYDTDAEREQAADAYFSEMFDPQMDAELEPLEAKAAKAEHFAHTFRYICPSYYVKGKQSWGAF